MTTTWMLISGNCFLHILISKYIFIYSHGTTPFTFHRRALLGVCAVGISIEEYSIITFSFRISRKRHYHTALNAWLCLLSTSSSQWIVRGGHSRLCSSIPADEVCVCVCVYKHIQIYNVLMLNHMPSAFNIGGSKSTKCTCTHDKRPLPTVMLFYRWCCWSCCTYKRCFMWLGGAMLPQGFDSSSSELCQILKLGPRNRANSCRHTQHTLIRDFRCAIYRHLCEFLSPADHADAQMWHIGIILWESIWNKFDWTRYFRVDQKHKKMK